MTGEEQVNIAVSVKIHRGAAITHDVGHVVFVARRELNLHVDTEFVSGAPQRKSSGREASEEEVAAGVLISGVSDSHPDPVSRANSARQLVKLRYPTGVAQQRNERISLVLLSTREFIESDAR